MKHKANLQSTKAEYILSIVMIVGILSFFGCQKSGKGDLLNNHNLILITIDTLRADYLGCYGDLGAKTPNIDLFSRSAVLFKNAVTVSNNTLPSHAAMLIGKHPHSFGIPANGFKLPSGQETLATILSKRGYKTAAFISASALESSLGLNRGFEVYDEYFDIKELDQTQRRSDSTIKAAINWLKKKRERPFFIWVHLFDPHYPYSPPPPFDTLFYPDYKGEANGSIPYIMGLSGLGGFPVIKAGNKDLKKVISLYQGEISCLDKNLKPLFDLLNQREHKDKTSIVFTADHGESLTEHNYFFNHGEHVYQPSMKIPLIIRRAGGLSGKIVEEQVETIDIFPTVLSQLLIKIPENTEGSDLSPLLESRSGWNKKLAFGEGCRPKKVAKLFKGKWLNFGKSQFVIDYPWKLIVVPYRNHVELYRLDHDPLELNNLIIKHKELGIRLMKELQRWRENAKPYQLTRDEENLEKIRALGYL